MSRANRKTVFDELLVLTKNRSLYYFIAAIEIIVEQWMSDVFHVYTNLVSTACFQNTFYQCNVTKSFHNRVMSNRFFAMIAFGIGFEQFSESMVSAHMRNNCPLIFLNVAPHQRKILPLDGMLIKLFRELAHGSVSFCNCKQAARVLIT